MSCDDGYRIGTPWPGTTTFQWVSSADGFTWADISGATSATYTLVSGDIGKYVGRRTTAGGVSAISSSTAVIAAGYPLGTPALLALDLDTAAQSNRNRESPSFSTSGKPILVVASQRLGTAADSTLTVTLGNAGRGFGTGTTVTFAGRTRRTTIEAQVLLLLAPGTNANQTVQVQCSDAVRGTQIAVYEVDGLTGLGTAATGGGTTVTSAPPAVTTTVADSGVLHAVIRFGPDKAANAITLTGCTEILNENTGATVSNNDFLIALGYEQAPTAGAYAASATWPTGETMGWLSIEMLS